MPNPFLKAPRSLNPLLTGKAFISGTILPSIGTVNSSSFAIKCIGLGAVIPTTDRIKVMNMIGAK